MNQNLIETDQVLNKHKFFEVRLMNGWYEYLRHTHPQCVCVLAIRLHNNEQQVLARIESCPAHFHNPDKLLPDGAEITSLTGMIDNPDLSPRETAVKELYEEAGIHIEPEEITYCGSVFPAKSSSSIMHLYFIDLTDHPNSDTQTPTGDGTRGEEGAFCIYMESADFFLRCTSPLPAAIAVRVAFMKEEGDEGIYHD